MIKIGIIDSGINETYRKQHSFIKGISLQVEPLTGKIDVSTDIQDRIGHGSECLKIIGSMVTDISYFIVKIFDHEMVADTGVLAAAIQTCIKEEVNIINISAGVIAPHIPKILGIACDEAYQNDVIIVAAMHNQGTKCYPAHHEKVIGVGAVDYSTTSPFFTGVSDQYEFYTTAADLYPDDIHWSNSTSFACAKLTGFAANILKRKGNMCLETLYTELINMQTPNFK